MSAARTVAAGALFAIALACRHSGVAATPAPMTRESSADTVVRGTVRVLGAEPMTTVVVRAADAGPAVAIVGPLRDEIASLDGVTISARGQAVANAPSPPRGVSVVSYEITAVGDVPARSGTLVRHGDGFWLREARDSVALAAPVPPSLAALAGRRVYVAGGLKGPVLSAQLFGAIGRP